jgi:protein-tyrosine phosphatase
MIDIHCHLLPGIDDGARTLDEALTMARASVDDGVNFAVMTPHLHPGRYENTRSTIELQLQLFRNALRKENIPLHIGMAAEVRLSPEVLSLIEQDEVPFLGELDGYRIMLLEFPHGHIPPGADNLVARLLQQKIRPIIAHPERNKDVMRNLAKIEPFIEMGCLLQITAGALLGGFGEGAYLCAQQLLEYEVFTVLASDAHNLKARCPGLREGMDAAAEILGKEAAYDLVYKNPLSIVWPENTNAQIPEQPTRTLPSTVSSLSSIKRDDRY